MEDDLKFRVVYIIDGVSDQEEASRAGELLLKVYNNACGSMNDGLTDLYNKEWTKAHEGVADMYNLPGYVDGYEKLFKRIADIWSNAMFRQFDCVYRLVESEPVLIYKDRGIFELRGYKEMK